MESNVFEFSGHTLGFYQNTLTYAFKGPKGNILSAAGLNLQIKHRGLIGYGVTAPIPDIPTMRRYQFELNKLLDRCISYSGIHPTLTYNLDMINPIFTGLINMAIYDLQAKIADKPFHFSLMPRAQVAEFIPVIGLLPPLPLENLIIEIERCLILKRHSYKLKVGDPTAPDLGLSEDLARIVEVRKLLPDTPLVLDANGVYSESDPMQYLKAFEPFNVSYIEEPISGIEQLQQLASKSPIPIAVDESCESITDLARLGHIDEISTIVVKPTRFTDMRTISQISSNLITEKGKRVVPSSAIDGGLGLAAAVHFAAVLPGAQENPAGLDTEKLYVYPDTTPIPVNQGVIYTPTEPGLGVNLLA